MYALNAAADGITPTLAYVWMWPLTTILTLGCGLLFGGNSHRENSQPPLQDDRKNGNQTNSAP